ncbi:MAG: HAD-IIIC family phosphatase [Deltaproteobacteria bacterium]|nr:HAD-IIIC family phosphatase [Deltaproteobacteria bacterium]
MFESEFANKKSWEKEQTLTNGFNSDLNTDDVRKTQLIYWREHCLECTPPECYHNCQLYIPRLDKRCLRIDYGIYPNEAFEGLFNFGADLRFKKWAKLSTSMYRIGLEPQTNNLLSKIDNFVALVINLIYKLTNPINPVKWFNKNSDNPQTLIHKTFAYFREKCIKGIEQLGNDSKFNCFVLECFSFEEKPFRLLLEYSESTIVFRDAYEIKPGKNYYEIPIENFNGTSNPLTGSIDIYPENNKDVRIAITWLDFVEFKRSHEAKNSADGALPAEKVKCVAWDLDNTLWEGILIESKHEEIKLRNESLHAIKKLDERGIIQTIVSKNNYDEVKAMLSKLGIWDFFLYPAINWAPKSSNLKQIAKLLNINIDTFALIDDQAFELAEVKSSLPQIRVYSDREITELLSYPEFDVLVTEASKLRRQSYLSQIKREKVVAKYEGGYESFLRECEMEMKLFIPFKPEHINRCYELLQRSNQLNLSTKRYTKTEFDNLLSKENFLCIALDCSDRFGDYGIVGFASVDESTRDPQLIDFVISCRVAQKMVEHTFFEWLTEYEMKKGRALLKVDLIRTKRNGPLVRVFEDLPFVIQEETDQIIRMYLPFEKAKDKIGIIRIEENITAQILRDNRRL